MAKHGRLAIAVADIPDCWEIKPQHPDEFLTHQFHLSRLYSSMLWRRCVCDWKTHYLDMLRSVSHHDRQGDWRGGARKCERWMLEGFRIGTNCYRPIRPWQLICGRWRCWAENPVRSTPQ